MEAKKRPNHRPNVYNSKAISVKVDGDLIERLNDQPNRNRFINDAIRKALDIL